MKYIRTYETEEKFLTDKDSTSRGFRLKPTLYKYSEAGDHVQLELDDPRKHGDSTYMEITLDSDTEFSFYIGNAPDDTQTTMNCSIDWGDGTVETKTIADEIIDDDNNKGFKLVHNYKAGSYTIELYGVERDYVTAKGTTYWGKYTSRISHPSSIRRVVLGGSIVSMGMSTFAGCSSLTSVYISEGVTSIGEGAFYGCTSLTSVYIPNSVTSIEYDAFYNCTSLTSIHIPESVTIIKAYMFGDCSSLTSIHISEGVTSIENCAFIGCTSLVSVYIPESVTSVAGFDNCTSLTSIHIPESVTSIEGFNNCTGLTSIRIPESVTSIGGYAFSGCTGLTSINIPEGVTSIGNYAFRGCAFTSIRIPEGVTSIGQGALDNCSNLTSISSLNPTAPNYWSFKNLPTNGTLHIKPGATGYDAWLSKLPSGWTIVEDL